MTGAAPGIGVRGSGITVTGTGTAPTAVDQVLIALGVEVVKAQPGEAFAAAAAVTTELLRVLADGGVSSKSVRTSDLTLGPRTDYQDGHPRVVGYQAGQRLTVLLEGHAGIDRLLGDVAELGGQGVRIDGLSLIAGNPRQAFARARESAFADATAKAEQLAELSGRTLGLIQWIDESPGDRPLHPATEARMMAADTAMPVATGSTTVRTDLAVHWAFAS